MAAGRTSPAPAAAMRIEDSEDLMVHTGVNIYWFGDTEQQRLLHNGLRRWAAVTRRRGLAHGFWFCLFDARGPHVCVTFCTDEGKQHELRSFLRREIHEFCERHPSATAVPAAEIGQRHRECRGRALCEIDRREGLAPNNSCIFFIRTAEVTHSG